MSDHAADERRAIINATLAPEPAELVVDFCAERQARAIREALEFLHENAPGRAVEALEKAML